MISVFTTRKNDCYEAALLTLTTFLVLVGCSQSEQMERDATSVPDSDSLLVYVVNYPLQYFAQRIGGDRIDVRFPAPADIDPAFWSPDGEDIAGFQRADLIFLNGAGYAAWVSRATLPQSKLVDTSAAFEDQLIPVESAITHTHGPEGAHSHGRIAFTVWLDATLALEQARAVRDALLEADPDGREGYNTRYEAGR